MRENREEISMSADRKSGPLELIRGIVEGVFGIAKQVIGTVIGRGDMVEEGEAQKDKADAQRNAAKKEAAAEKARGVAKANEKRQQANQR